jgi:hypothetical protein
VPIVPLSLAKPKLLIGEGSEEVRFFNALLLHLVLGDIQVEQYGGKSRLASYLRNLVNIPGFEGLISLGVTRDADTDADRAFQSIRNALQNAHIPSPARIGDSASDNGKSVSVFVLPDNVSSGMLENLCLAAVESDGAIECLDDYLACVLRTCNRQPENPAKARVHAWLASQRRADLRLGEAAEVGYWPWHSPAFEDLRRFLQNL